MLDISKFVLEIIRKDASLSWLGNNYEKFVSLLVPQLKMLLENKAFIIITDNDRRWFGEYIVSTINSKTEQRPMLPFFLLDNLYPNISKSRKDELIYLDDMLNIVFQNGVNYFYIGKRDYYLLDFANQQDNSYLWILDEENDNSIYFNSEDENLNCKLIRLFSILEKCIDKTIFGEIVIP